MAGVRLVRRLARKAATPAPSFPLSLFPSFPLLSSRAHSAHTRAAVKTRVRVACMPASLRARACMPHSRSLLSHSRSLLSHSRSLLPPASLQARARAHTHIH
jgi:hypothetical protein